MPYDDSNVKRMIRYQTERKVGFSSRKTLSNDVKILIHGMLEADVNRRLTMSQALESPWLYGVANPFDSCSFFPSPSHNNSADARSSTTLRLQQSGEKINVNRLPVTEHQMHNPDLIPEIHPETIPGMEILPKLLSLLQGEDPIVKLTIICHHPAKHKNKHFPMDTRRELH